ncbi:hypothetical protein [Thermaerobacter composti]|uniref:Alcohol dehydrogenase n=1 Tax=Thermaerobacter composti TaxID=554949 RepID=A0ABZ0QM45_9FIRM|nr:hypothetical protein [Thermaerobacter composti]WPD18571.1 hypothetical protein Q5761_09415 [Thermaerobacter composti]
MTVPKMVGEDEVMRAWRVVHELGPPQQALQLEEIPEPTVRRGTVKIQVEAAALHRPG